MSDNPNSTPEPECLLYGVLILSGCLAVLVIGQAILEWSMR